MFRGNCDYILVLTYPGCPNSCVDAVFRERLNVYVAGAYECSSV